MTGRVASLACWLTLIAAFDFAAFYRLVFVAPAHPYPVTAGVIAGALTIGGLLVAFAEFLDYTDRRYERRIHREMARNLEER